MTRYLALMGAAIAAVALVGRAQSGAQRLQFSVVEATIPQMRDAMKKGRVTSRELVQQYLVRIATYEDRLNAVIAINPARWTRPRNASASGRRGS